MLHLFDFPHEGLELSVEQVMRGFGEVVKVKKQTYLSDHSISTGTRLVSIQLKDSTYAESGIKGSP